ncbi:MAG TPA: enolase C-terminal domain-like protein [Acidimicrobiia bacterium]|nr:enolase C-terminal domain-like protein [Acidimicrobiia bacterium]
MPRDPVAVRLHVLEIPLREPFRTATGRIDRRTTVLVEIGTDVVGWGEAAPYPGQDETIGELMSLAREGIATATVAAAINEAMSDRGALLAGDSLLPSTTTTVPVSVSVGIDGALDRVEMLLEQGIRAFKVKVAPGETRHLGAIRDRYSDITLGVDGNRSFPALADDDRSALTEAGLAYIEEPFSDWESPDAMSFADTGGIPMFADETAATIDGALRALDMPSVAGVTVKPGRLGWSGALAVVEAATRLGKQWRASGLIETGIGRAYTDLLASDPTAFISDVAPAELFLRADVTASRFAGGVMRVPSGPGLGVVPDPDLLAAYRTDLIEVEIVT